MSQGERTQRSAGSAGKPATGTAGNSVILRKTDPSRSTGAARFDGVREERQDAARQIARSLKVWRSVEGGSAPGPDGAEEEPKDGAGAEAAGEGEAEGAEKSAQVEDEAPPVGLKVFRAPGAFDPAVATQYVERQKVNCSAQIIQASDLAMAGKDPAKMSLDQQASAGIAACNAITTAGRDLFTAQVDPIRQGSVASLRGASASILERTAMALETWIGDEEERVLNLVLGTLNKLGQPKAVKGPRGQIGAPGFTGGREPRR